VVRCWHGYLSGARCRLAHGPADATATHCLLLQKNLDWFYLSGTAHPGSPGKRAVKRVCVFVAFLNLAAAVILKTKCNFFKEMKSFMSGSYVWGLDACFSWRLYSWHLVIDCNYHSAVLSSSEDFLPTQHYANAVLAVALCLCVCVGLSQFSVLLKHLDSSS